MRDSSAKPQRIFSPGAAILAWLWPGAGHMSHGETKRGVLIMAGVLLLFFCGLLVGGIDAVDRRNDKLWFLAQSLCGPISFIADYANQQLVQGPMPDFHRNGGARIAYQERNPELMTLLRREGLGRVNEMGTLFIALAGLMNLVVVLDALYYEPRPLPERRGAGEAKR
jgi:hypothetical protein